MAQGVEPGSFNMSRNSTLPPVQVKMEEVADGAEEEATQASIGANNVDCVADARREGPDVDDVVPRFRDLHS